MVSGGQVPWFFIMTLNFNNGRGQVTLTNDSTIHAPATAKPSFIYTQAWQQTLARARSRQALEGTPAVIFYHAEPDQPH